MKYTKRKIAILIVCIFMGLALKAQNAKFGHEFAPHEGLVKLVEKPFRDEICLNGFWQFMLVDLQKSISINEIKNPKLPENENWEQTPIKIPSPWNVNGFTNGEGGDFRAFPSYPKEWNNAKSGWLKKNINVPEDWSGNRIILHFEAVAGYAKVFVDGNVVGENFDAFLPFSFDITEHATAGKNVEVMVWVAHGSLLNEPGKYGRRNYVAGSFWGIYIAGIWQDVYLQKLPNVYITDTYIKPHVNTDELEIEVSIKNNTAKTVKLNLNAEVNRWINKNGRSVYDIPQTNWELGEQALKYEKESVEIEANSTKVFSLSTKVNGALDYWGPSTPNLYGLVLALNGKKQTLDKSYTRFGWRQFEINGTELQLNGKPIQIKGDSWHFTGVSQMTRRYAYAWYQMLMDANANGVRLHAQVFPRFYLEMADEMGICILDETAIWSSDGGPKIDSDIYWEACTQHVKRLVLRDRNYPSVFGWSVCNETLPVTKHVFNAPDSLIQKNIEEINNWVAIVRKYDPTRTWISGDGETQAETDLPTVIGHYGGDVELKRWSSQGKPWGIGETGMAYYGTPAQVAKINGTRAYESQLGRMEGLAGEAFDLISKQRNHKASYTSIFNLAWYGLKPLALGLNNVSMPSTLRDGIFFDDYTEGKSGYQPERIGPYSSTFNPGYDPMLPLYETWPLFDAVKAAFSDNYTELHNIWNVKQDNIVLADKAEQKESMVWLSANQDSELKDNFEKLGIKFDPLESIKKQLIIIDGSHSPELSEKENKQLKAAINYGSTALIWGATPQSKTLIENITDLGIKIHERNATSYVIKGEHAMLRNQNNSSYYFSEITKKPISNYTLGGEWVNQSRILLEACNTDWHKWNYNGEDVKTAWVYKDEREAKKPGSVTVKQSLGAGEIIVTTLDLFALGNQSKHMVRNSLSNLGGLFKGKGIKIPDALNKDGFLENVNFLGSVKNDSHEIDLVFDFAPLSDEKFQDVKIGTATNGIYWDVLSANEDGIFDFASLNLKHKNYASVYLSFWMYSPRSLTDLLIEPDMPRLDMHFGADDALAFCVNGKQVKAYLRKSGFVENEITFEGFPLEKGWNHVLIKVGQQTDDWKCKVQFTSTKPEFLNQIKSVVDRK